MNTSEMARILGRRGGRARAHRLPARERSRIAKLGAAARMTSLEAARRIEANLRYADAVNQLQGNQIAVHRSSTSAGPLPQIPSASRDGRPR